MCRLLAYLGDEPTSLSRYTLEAPHSLEVQGYAPQEMLSGVVNADGFGAGWYTNGTDGRDQKDGEVGEPAVYRSLSPIWSDATFHSIAPKIRSRIYFAALRNATPPLPSELAAVPPFSSGRYLFMHNGAIDAFRESVMRPMRDSLSARRYLGIVGASDSETIFALLLEKLDDGAGLREALLETVTHVRKTCAGYGTRATLNLGLTDGEEMVFVRYSTEGPDNSLYVREGEGVLVASERLDGDGRWEEVPSRSLVIVGSRRVGIEAVDI